LSITPNQGQACQHSGFVSIDTADQQDVSATTEVDMSLSVWKEPIANLVAKAELVRIMVEYGGCSTRIREQVSYMSDYILKGSKCMYVDPTLVLNAVFLIGMNKTLN
jgi:hypothetical protein